MVLFRHICIVLVFLVSTSFGVYAGDRMSIAELLGTPTKDLIDKGNLFLIEQHNQDSALLCYTIVADRYNRDMPDNEKLITAKILLNTGTLYYEFFHDYALALEALKRGYDISRQLGDNKLSGILLERIGDVYALCAQLSSSHNIGARSADYYIRSYRLSRATGDTRSILRNIVNIVSLALDRKNITSEVRLAIKDFNDFIVADSVPDQWLYEGFINAGNHIVNEDYKSALKEFSSVNNTINSKNTALEMKPQVLENMIECCMKLGLYSDGLAYSDSLVNVSRQNSYLYDEAMATRLRGSLYSLAGKREKATADSLRFYQLRDSVMGIDQIKLIEHIESIADMRAENCELLYERHKHEKQRIFFIMLVVVLFSVILFSIILYLRHLKLRESYRQLYLKQQAEIKREDAERLERNKSGNSPASRSLRTGELSEMQRSEYRVKILLVMDNEDAIFSSEFSLDRLAEMTGIKPRTLSVSLNEIFGKNFYELLNEYRVREACRRLSDHDKYGHLTIEAISQNVGYKSRTSLVSAFKKITGLTPSAYQKMSATEFK